MKPLLDTHVLLWVSQDHPHLTKQAKELIVDSYSINFTDANHQKHTK